VWVLAELFDLILTLFFKLFKPHARRTDVPEKSDALSARNAAEKRPD